MVQKISVELIQKDSLEKELQETQKLVTIFNTQISFQDSIILILEQKEINYLNQIESYCKDHIHMNLVFPCY
jgi:hypothetical protein